MDFDGQAPKGDTKVCFNLVEPCPCRKGVIMLKCEQMFGLGKSGIFQLHFQ